MDASEKAYRADKARQIIDDPLYLEAVALAEQRDVEWLLSMPADVPEMTMRMVIERMKARRGIGQELRNLIQIGKEAVRPRPGVV